jgi:hypothetical protein
MAVNEKELQYAGEFIIDTCMLYTTKGLELDITDLLASVNIYEDIFSNSITGDISLADTNNLLANAPIIGQEKLKLKLINPQAGTTDRKNSVEFIDIPLHIYKVNSRFQTSERSIAYNLAFTTYELIRNGKTRVVSSYEGEPTEDIIKKILRDPELLNSKKEFYYETTTNNFKVVAPSQRPFDFINSIARRCLSKNYDFAPTFLFYETVKGYYFRTLEGMMDRKNPRIVFKELTPNRLNDQGVIDAAENLTNILNYEIVNSIDTIANNRVGMYNGQLLVADLYNHHLKKYDWNYLDEYDKFKHVDEHTKYDSSKSPMASESPEDGKRISDWPESVLYLQTTDKDVADTGLLHPSATDEPTFDYNGVDLWLMQRKSRFAQISSALTLRVEVPGNAAIQAGDLIGLEMRNQGSTDEEDTVYTGKYLVTKVRQMYTVAEGRFRHHTHMEVVRDTSREPLPAAVVPASEGGDMTELELPLGSADPGDVTF